MKIKRFERKSNNQIKEEIKDAFSEMIDSYDVQIGNSYKLTYNFIVSIGIPESKDGNMFNLSQFQAQDPNQLDNAVDVIKFQSNNLINIFSLIKESLSKIKDSTKSFVVEMVSDEYTGPERIVIHLRMYFT